MSDLHFSSVTRLTGGDELHAVDVIYEFGKKKMLVKSDNELSSDLHIFSSDAQIALPNATETTIVSQGAGTISGLVYRFSKTGVIIKLVVDGNEIFNINTNSLRDVIDWNNAPQPVTYVSVNSNRRTFYFTPRFPLRANTSILLTVTPTGNNTDIIGEVRQITS